ncbi:MAG: DUF512 domain-containing protein, partial [Clostridiaceae bacterium]|nr:DUF512 domain-containing protein [Clostridiaceae bacterium]
KRLEKKKKHINVATSVLSFPFIERLVKEVMKYAPDIKIDVYKLENNFFGGHVTVAGLLTGQDLLDGLKKVDLKDGLLISRTMLKADEDIFLDNYSLKQISKELKTTITAVNNNGAQFIEALIK